MTRTRDSDGGSSVRGPARDSSHRVPWHSLTEWAVAVSDPYRARHSPDPAARPGGPNQPFATVQGHGRLRDTNAVSRRRGAALSLRLCRVLTRSLVTSRSRCRVLSPAAADPDTHRPIRGPAGTGMSRVTAPAQAASSVIIESRVIAGIARAPDGSSRRRGRHVQSRPGY